MARLNDQQKQYIVQRLACFRGQAEVVDELADVFGIKVDRRQVHYYDPSAPASKTPKKWRAIFDATRVEWLNATANVGIAHERYRLERLQDLYDRASRMGNVPLCLQVLEQASKEVGGYFTNRHKVEHAGRVKVSGVMILPAEIGSKEWQEIARTQQETLAAEADDATRKWLGRKRGPEA
jgi:hypothetical protein